MLIRQGTLMAAGGLLLVLGAQSGAWSQPQAGSQGGPAGPPPGGALTRSDEVSQVDPQIHVDAAGRVYRLWTDSRGKGGDIRFQRSVDGGQTWSAPMVLDRDKPKVALASSPVLITDPAGRVMVMWREKFREAQGTKEIQFLSSPDGGATWPGPLRVLNREGQGFGGDLSTDGQGHVYAAWYDERRIKSPPPGGSGRARQEILMIFFNRSEDSGQHWLTEDVRLSGAEGTEKSRSRPFISALPRMQSDRQGRVYVAWVDNRAGRTEIYVRVSQDHGKSWGPESNVSRGALSATNHQILTDGAGRVFLLWNDSRHGVEDVFFARSENGGKEWAEPVRLSRHQEGVVISTAPHMALARDGRVYVAWQDRRNGREDIYLNISADWGRTWLDTDIRLDRDDPGTGVSQFPHVLVVGDARVVVAWSDDRTGHDQILLNESADGGKTWLEREIRVDMDTERGEHARGVKLATDGNGVIHAVWEVSKGEGTQIQKRVGYRRLVLPPVTVSGAAPVK